MEYKKTYGHEESINRTVDDAVMNLEKYNKCVMFRPYTFNIVLTINKIIKKQRFKNILCLHAYNNALKIVDGIKGNIIPMHYSKLDQDVSGDYDLIIMFDLSYFYNINHYKSLIESEEWLKQHKVLGIDSKYASIEGQDIVYSLFDSHMVYQYNLADAIKDNILKTPYYIYAIDKQNKDIGKTELVGINKAVRDSDIIENASEIISEAVNLAYKSKPKYMKFLVFMSRKELINERSDEIKQWFIDAFPKYKVRDPIKVYSDQIGGTGIKTLNSLNSEDNTIDIIISINMLNNSDDIDDVTGVIFLRNTVSSDIYSSQIGCAMKSSKNPPIIIDFVSNILTPHIFMKSSSNGEQKNVRTGTTYDLGLTYQTVKVYGKAAKLEELIIKLNEGSSKSVEKMIIRDRMSNIPYPADYLAKKYNVNIKDVIKIIEKYDKLLSLYNRGIHSRDTWVKGIIGGERIDLK